MGLTRRALLLLAGSLAISCRTAAPKAPPAATADTPVPAPSPLLPDSVHWFRNSAEYRAAAYQAYSLATRRLEALATGRAPGTWGVILDADETVLDNSQYQKERSLQGLGFTPESWREWVRRRSAGAVPGAAAFLAAIRAKGGRIAIVTNRTTVECPDTEETFRTLRLVYDAMLCKPERGKSEKEPRFDQVAAGDGTGLPPLEVLMFVGDNIQDFPGLRQDLRIKPAEAFAPFGDRYIVLPNPMYGSWEKNPRE